MDWFKLSTNGILRGSLSTAPTSVQLTWIKLLALMSETHLRNGRFEYAQGKPYTPNFIATSCGITEQELSECLNEYFNDINPDSGLPRMSWDDKTLIITNWTYYQASPSDRVKTPIDQEAINKMTIRNAVKNPDLAHRAEQINGNQVVSPQGEILNSPVDQSVKEFGEVCTIYSDNIDKKLSAMIADELQLIYDESGLEWFREAVKIACKANVRKLSYVQGILKDWHTNGYKNGNHHKPEPINSDIGGVNPKKFENQKFNNLVQR